jgi:arylsulfatase A-like enzyme
MRYHGRIGPGRTTAALVELIDLVPTILELCGTSLPANLHGRSMIELLREKASTHRERVFAEYADNEEAMIRTERWKLIYGTSARRRQDGYADNRPSLGPCIQLYDLENDPDELINLAGRAEHAGQVEQLTHELADHLARTAREPHLIPKSEDVRSILAHCLAPRDVDGYRYLQNATRSSRASPPSDVDSFRSK